jgi:hypothetical protein
MGIEWSGNQIKEILTICFCWGKLRGLIGLCPRHLWQAKSLRLRPKCLRGEGVRKGKEFQTPILYSPSSFPPLNGRPSSRALRPNGISSSVAENSCVGSAADIVVKRRCDTLRAREQRASESIPASVRRGSCELLAMVEARKVCRKRTTSSSTSSSHRLSLSPSEARTRMSSARTGSAITCAALGGVLDTGPSCSGVLNWQWNVSK